MRKNVILGVLLSLVSVSLFAAKAQYEYHVVGSSADVTTSTTAGTVLAGGGTDVAAAFQWMITKSGGGDEQTDTKGDESNLHWTPPVRGSLCEMGSEPRVEPS